MSEDLLRKLQSLEEDYFGQPPVVQQADLREINQLRAQLSMPLVDARLKDTAAVEQAVQPVPEAVPDHTEARAIYHAYLKKLAELEANQAYAKQVADATAGPGQTPVRPPATMGTNGGPLLCDNCGKHIRLEGAPFHGLAADAAWKKKPTGNWTSWVLGGMLVEIQTNGTLRIYHGYPGGNDKECCNAASRDHDEARARFESKGAEKRNLILAFIEHEFPAKTENARLELLYQILDAMYGFDPGLGINRPSGES